MPSKRLQQEWNQYGKGSFSFDQLETLEKDETNPYFNEKKALSQLEAEWLEKLQPYVTTSNNSLSKYEFYFLSQSGHDLILFRMCVIIRSR